MKESLRIEGQNLSLRRLEDWVFRRREFGDIEIPQETLQRAQKSRLTLMGLIEKRLPIYGVTTGFGDSCHRSVDPSQTEELQANLVSYLLCGTGPRIPRDAVRATFAIRLNSLSRGFSGVSPELLNRMKLYLERDWMPIVPREGSLGASGDLIPLAFYARLLQGEGDCDLGGGQVRPMPEVLREAGVAPYRLQAKEGLALVNGTSSMAGLFLVNLNQARFLMETLTTATSWFCLALKGRTEAFNKVINEQAKRSPGQARIAHRIRDHLDAENYTSKPLDQIRIQDFKTEEFVQDRYSLRCVPQILGPVAETIDQLERWLEDEINSVSDNPLIDDDGHLSMGGNFYGGYMSQGMDYLKISLAHMADLLDRQLTMIIDDKSNRGLPANLAHWGALPENQRHLHHGLKGLHQATNAITSEILARATPNGIFSRSSESHNQDKVSLGMSAAVQCAEMLEPMFTITAMHLTVLAQALDLRGIKINGRASKALYDQVRAAVPFVTHDQSLAKGIESLRQELKGLACQSQNTTS